MKLNYFTLSCIFFSTFLIAQTRPPESENNMRQRAVKIHESVITIDTHNDIDVKGKIILRLSGLPEGSKPDKSRYALYRASLLKDALAKKLGAVGILEVDPGNINGEAWTPEPAFLNNSPAENGTVKSWVRYIIPKSEPASIMPRASITLNVASIILSGGT